MGYDSPGQPHRPPSRRELMKNAAALGVLPAVAGLAPGEGARAAKPDLVRRENEKPGTREWMLTKTRVDPATKYRCPWVEGFCSKVSVRAGETLNVFVSTDPPSPFRIDFYRTGYYGGAGGRLVHSVSGLKGKKQPDPPVGERRLRECRWEPAVTLTVPQDWASGVYVGKLTAEREGLQSYIIFVVRDDRPADFIFQCSDTTWQAYNRWPSQFSLYDDGKSEWYWGPGVDVSFDRPYGKYCQILDQPLSIGSGEWFLWEFPLCYWMEQHGYDVTYVSNLDTHADPAAALRRAKGFLSVGHDEYYSIEMFDKLKEAIRLGLNVAFLSGNTCCGRIDPRPARDGRRDRIFSRFDRFGPKEGKERFDSLFKLPHASPNENTLIGARSTGEVTGGADFVCVKPGHWLFEGTGMKPGDGIPGLVGWEWHGDAAVDVPGLEVVASAMTTDGRGNEHGAYASTVYPGPGGKGNFVFNASTCWWADALSEPPGYVRPKAYAEPKGPDERARRITRNVLERMRRA